MLLEFEPAPLSEDKDEDTSRFHVNALTAPVTECGFIFARQMPVLLLFRFLKPPAAEIPGIKNKKD